MSTKDRQINKCRNNCTHLAPRDGIHHAERDEYFREQESYCLADPKARHLSRRALLGGAAGGMAVAAIAALERVSAAAAEPTSLADETSAFVCRCARADGGYAPSPDPNYPGYSDTGLSDLAAVTYAATLAKTMGWQLPQPRRSIQFIHRHQQPDGAFRSQGGSFEPNSHLAVLYNTVQAVVALRALGERPKIDPVKVMDRFFVDGAFEKLPWYATSFFPLFYAALGRPFPEPYDRALRDLQVRSQKDDGYLGDHVAATFHMAHYFRLTGRPTPKAAQMVRRVLRDQRPDGGWNIKEPDWDVHACFDAVFILRQLGGQSEAVRRPIQKGADWALACRHAQGGFGHYPGRHADMDAVYFQFGTLIQAGRLPTARLDLPDGHTLSWGHAMKPGRVY
ncbi:MAG: prenyltransferase/squalene oxidase repeat-containing protein [Thermoguttaceae bacterium]|jgi:geranylgeranyl transferase type-2 subunit beta